jgi:excisionase family DNA binding protein
MKNPEEIIEEYGRNNLFAKPYLSLEEACDYLSLSKACLYLWSSKKINLPFYKIGKKLLYKVSDLNEFIENHRIKPMHEIKDEVLQDSRGIS